jgi:hypothetical protein
MPDTLTELRAREHEVAREWRWLQDMLNKVARMRADQQDTRMFQMLQHQALIVGERRVHLQQSMAELSGESG